MGLKNNKKKLTKHSHLQVIVVDDELVPQVSKSPQNRVSSFQSKGLMNALQKSLNRTGGNFTPNLPPLQEDEVEEHDKIIFKPTAIVDDESGNVFGFQTPNKTKTISKADSSSKHQDCMTSSPKTPKSTKNKRTPLSKCKTPTSRLSSPARLPKRLLTPKTNEKTTPTTPYSLRKKVKKNLVRASTIDEDSDEAYDDSDLDGNFSPTDEEESDDENFVDINDNNTPMKMLRGLLKKGIHTPMRTPRRGRLHKVDVDMVATSDDYFNHNSDSTACVTSDHTLNRLENPRLGPDVLKSILEGVHQSHEQEKQDLLDDHGTLFPHWMTLLTENYSVFLCGVGSKKKLLSMFQQEMLSDIDHVVLNGFFPSLTLKSIMVTILEDILCVESVPQSLNDQMRIIKSHYDYTLVDPIVMVINNLDGPMLRSDKTQWALSQLASFKGIHVIASIDHINAPLIFDASKHSAYNPLWFDATTLASYSEETSYENSLMVQQSGSLALSSLIHVFKSLTPNAKDIFLLLARFQLDQKDNPAYNGMSFVDLYKRCRENFLVNSDLTLRAQLTEFRDHKLIRMKKGYDGVENLLIPLESTTLIEFIEENLD